MFALCLEYVTVFACVCFSCVFFFLFFSPAVIRYFPCQTQINVECIILWHVCKINVQCGLTQMFRSSPCGRYEKISVHFTGGLSMTRANKSSCQSECGLSNSYKKHPPLIAYIRDPNLRGMLVRSKLRQPASRTPGTTPCNQAKCGTCPFICTNTSVTGTKSQMNITKQFNCLTYNTVYVIHCTKWTLPR